MNNETAEIEAHYQAFLRSELGGLTTVAWAINQAIGFLGIVLIPVQLVTTCILGAIGSLTFGLLPLLLSIPWIVLLGLLLGTSWLWLKVPLIRPVVLVPGLVVAFVSREYAAMVPEHGDFGARLIKQNLGASWPLSYRLFFERMSTASSSE